MKYPLVNILMPVFRYPSYFQHALKSVLLQTYPNLEIIIHDNTAGDEVKRLVEKEFLPYSDKIIYYRNNRPFPRLAVFHQLYDEANGEFINYLMEEDFFYPTKIERMVKFFINDTAKNIKLVTSYRQPIDWNGNKIPDLIFTAKRHPYDSIIDGISLGDSMIAESNWIGEPTTVLFRKSDLIEPFGQFGGYQFKLAYDMGSWLTLLSQGKGVYIADALSFVRIHPQRNDWASRIDSLSDLMHLITFSPAKGFLKNSSTRQKFKSDIHQYIDSILSDQLNPPTMDETIYLLQCKNNLDRVQ